jgi:hypothetical protein
MTVGKWLADASVPGYLALFIGNVLSVGLLTWLLMPLVNRAFAFWLNPGGARPVLTATAGAALVAACWGVFLLIFARTTG